MSHARRRTGFFIVTRLAFGGAAAVATTALAVAGAAAGCSSSAGLPPATMTDARVIDDRDPRGPKTGEPATDFPQCPIPGPFDTSDEPFKTPTPFQAGGCATSDLQAMEDAIHANANITLDEVIGKTSASCQACAYGPSTALTWTPIVSGVTVGTQTGTIYSTGACMAVASGKDDCGRAYAGWSDCLQMACDACDPSATNGCLSAAQQAGAACGPQAADLSSACGASVNDYLTACNDLLKVCTTCGGINGAAQYVYELPIIAQCIQAPASADAGDAGDASDAGDGG